MKANDGKIYSCNRLNLHNLSIVEEDVINNRKMFWVTDPSYAFKDDSGLLRLSVFPDELVEITPIKEIFTINFLGFTLTLTQKLIKF